MISTLSLVALGGAIGAALRFLSGVAMLRLTGPQDFPLAIITVNVVGSFLMGAFVVFAAHKGLTHYSPFVMTGLLGGFTTFSAFSLETVTLIERQAYGQAGLYVCASVGLSVAALMLGLWASRGILG
ncbi:fluoride efflux transporter CrcB [Sulfitobacter sp. PR48]|jgi:CrcB protein|uniref:Fluoride-specific ion channel FluC n=1 Tax=Sulfitobacter porphyrae TaxID=1246864 RepID=A0ABW2B0M6_9RHOB|nr:MULTISPECIES: fluoride efflux transporter CrcB [unclassified Sulfitobacter]MCZ4257379.1 fluoride efflux transporter CrcB [Sulfitobacter sp. G21635-S1]MDD9722090.1 fluoride efflux transporter CrcB [Sulfitobacter sp. PR48]GLT09100.1 putative fluoride ion transporter CrcB [Sulfitobacter porphyrae]